MDLIGILGTSGCQSGHSVLALQKWCSSDMCSGLSAWHNPVMTLSVLNDI